MLRAIQLHYRYNSASTAALLEALRALTREQYLAPGCSGHGSIRDTLAHLLTTQWGWFSWFDGSTEPARAMALRVAPEEVDALDDARRRWEAIDRQTGRCIGLLTEANLVQEWELAMPGRKLSLPLWQLLLHVANHGTHTRAQIVAALRRAGHAPGDYELFRFALAERSPKP